MDVSFPFWNVNLFIDIEIRIEVFVKSRALETACKH